MSETVRVYVPKGNQEFNEGGKRQSGYRVSEENETRTIYEVPEDEVEQFSKRVGGLQELSE